jgi:hypothetical protein
MSASYGAFSEMIGQDQEAGWRRGTRRGTPMTIDLQAAIETAEELLTELRRLDGAEADDAPTRKAQRERVETSRTLLYMAHLADRARVQVMDAYFAYKEQADPVRIAGTGD